MTLDSAVGALVTDGVRRYGRLPARPQDVDPLDESTRTPRWWRALRLKEWVGFTLVHPQWAGSMILQDAKYLASSEIYLTHRASGTMTQHAANARGGSLRLPASFAGSEARFAAPGYRIGYDLGTASGTHRLDVDVAATASSPAVQGELVLDVRAASPELVVSSRLPGGTLYTTKALYPVAGELHVGGETVVFDPARDLAILDEHRSALPYRTRWTWGTFGLRADGGAPIGANFATRPSVPGGEDESGIWSTTECEPLTGVLFVPAGDPTGPWRVASDDGRLDVEFRPDGRKGVRHQLGVFSIDYWQAFGRYHGTLRADGRAYTIDGVPGVLEQMRARL